MADRPEPLRVMLADGDERRLDDMAKVVGDLGHAGRLVNVAEIAEATRRERPDVAIVGLGEQTQHALELISELVKKAACPVIADLEADDDEFIDNAARRGIFANVKHGERPSWPARSTSCCAAAPTSAASTGRSGAAP